MSSKMVMILGKSGAGKSTSMRNLDSTKTKVFSPLGKGVPVRGEKKLWKVWNKETCPDGNVIVTSSSKAVAQWLKHIDKNMPHITTIVIDDFGFLNVKELDRRIGETGYQKFSDIAHDFLQITEIGNTLRDNLVIYCMNHCDTIGDGVIDEKFTKALGVGKMIDEKLASIEAQYEIVLMAVKLTDGNNNISYKFKTRCANSTVKSPMGCFEEEYIDNDLELVNKALSCYYNDDCTESEDLPKEVKKK